MEQYKKNPIPVNKLEQENLRRFQIKTNDTELLSEAENVLQKHQLSSRF